MHHTKVIEALQNIGIIIRWDAIDL